METILDRYADLFAAIDDFEVAQTAVPIGEHFDPPKLDWSNPPAPHEMRIREARARVDACFRAVELRETDPDFRAAAQLLVQRHVDPDEYDQQMATDEDWLPGQTAMLVEAVRERAARQRASWQAPLE